jgi:hypothetical protein
VDESSLDSNLMTYEDLEPALAYGRIGHFQRLFTADS